MDSIISHKNKHPKIFLDGFEYTLDRSYNETDYFFCSNKKRESNCGARLIRYNNVEPGENNDNMKITGIHLHAPDAGKVECYRLAKDLKWKAAEKCSTSRDIVGQIISNANTAVRPILPSVDQMMRTVRRTRALNFVPKNPNNLKELVLENEFIKIIDGKQFLLYDSWPNDQRLIIFSTQENFKFLASCSSIHMDGTFSVVPPLFSQLYTLHGGLNGLIVPLVYVLACNKKQETYNIIMKTLLEQGNSIKPKYVIMDFEKAAINSVKNSFPEALVHGCFFHFSKNIWRHIQSIGLQTSYKNCSIFAMNLKYLLALAFVPEEMVIDAFGMISELEFYVDNDDKEYNSEIQNLLNYFEVTYIGLPLPGTQQRRKKSLYPIELWNMYNITKSGESRTNNAIEGWHNAIRNAFGTHPNIFNFINKIKNEQAITETKPQQFPAGGEPYRKRKKKYKDFDQRLFNTVNSFEKDERENDLINYMLAIAHNLKF
ncbi:uncharacterized protein [Eurosta solidaginis]|uniref:uncharacterized protein n=1 Tax=Eurosta solidaginis TaxID=178769 RepID=UPI00353066EE